MSSKFPFPLSSIAEQIKERSEELKEIFDMFYLLTITWDSIERQWSYWETRSWSNRMQDLGWSQVVQNFNRPGYTWTRIWLLPSELSSKSDYTTALSIWGHKTIWRNELFSPRLHYEKMRTPQTLIWILNYTARQMSHIMCKLFTNIDTFVAILQ